MGLGRFGQVVVLLVICTVVCAAEPPPESWHEEKLLLLDKISYHPSLLPMILQNRDYLELTPEQLASFRDWRRENFDAMFERMKEIVRLRTEFNEAALRPDTSADILRGLQAKIFLLHKEVLDYKLSCRENIVNTFSAAQWEGLEFLVRESE